MLSAQQALRRGGGDAGAPAGDDTDDEVETTISNLLEMLSSERAQRAELEAELARQREAAEAERDARSRDAAQQAAAAAAFRDGAAAARARDAERCKALQRQLAEQARDAACVVLLCAHC